MKLGKSALLEIVAIVQDGLMGIKDASVGLRELDLEEQGASEATDPVLELTEKYIKTHPRAGDWEKN